MKLFGRRTSQDQLAEKVLDQHAHQQAQRLLLMERSYMELVADLEDLVRPGRTRVTRTEIRYLLDDHQRILAGKHGDQPSPTVV